MCVGIKNILVHFLCEKTSTGKVIMLCVYLSEDLLDQGFLRRFRDPIRVPRISNRVPRFRENYYRVPKILENRVRRNR